MCSNNTNKLSPQEPETPTINGRNRSNNTNKLSPQELLQYLLILQSVQIIQINLVLKNSELCVLSTTTVQIIQINLVLKNEPMHSITFFLVQIIQINLVLKNLAIIAGGAGTVQIIQINLVLKNRRPYYSIFMLYLQYILSISIIKC